MANEATSRMLICLWKDCDNVFADAAALQGHVTKHVQEQIKPHLDNKQIDDTEEEKGLLAKKAKLNDGVDKIANQFGIGKSKIVFLAIEVWTDVLGFIKRIRLAGTISLTNRQIHQICWPRLHGDKVKAYKIGEITIVSRVRFDYGRPPKALVLKDGKIMPMPSCPPPSYICGFRQIIIRFLDDQVLDFFKRIASCISSSELRIDLLLGHKRFVEQQVLSVNRLLKTFLVPDNLSIQCAVGNIRCLQNVEDKILVNYLRIDEESDIPILMEFLASPRPDGQQRVVVPSFANKDLEHKLLATIKMEYHSSSQSLPQPFYIKYHRLNLTVLECVEENPKTNETLTIVINKRAFGSHINICRHPKGQYELMAEDARKRLGVRGSTGTGITNINVEF